MTPFGSSDRPIDQFLFDAVQMHSVRTRGQRAKRVTMEYDDGSSATLLPPGGHAQPAPAPADVPSWPPDEGWAFRPGEASFDGTRFKITGKPLAILVELARTPGDPVTVEKLKRVVWHEEPEHVEDGNLQGHLSHLRKKLRDALGLEKDFDPVPNVGGAYRLAIH